MSSQTRGSLAPLKRFLALFLTAWAIVLAYLGFSHHGSTRVIFIAAAAVCLLFGLYFFRSFAFARRKEF